MKLEIYDLVMKLFGSFGFVPGYSKRLIDRLGYPLDVFVIDDCLEQSTVSISYNIPNNSGFINFIYMDVRLFHEVGTAVCLSYQNDFLEQSCSARREVGGHIIEDPVFCDCLDSKLFLWLGYLIEYGVLD